MVLWGPQEIARALASCTVNIKLGVVRSCLRLQPSLNIVIERFLLRTSSSPAPPVVRRLAPSSWLARVPSDSGVNHLARPEASRKKVAILVPSCPLMKLFCHTAPLWPVATGQSAGFAATRLLPGQLRGTH